MRKKMIAAAVVSIGLLTGVAVNAQASDWGFHRDNCPNNYTEDCPNYNEDCPRYQSNTTSGSVANTTSNTASGTTSGTRRYVHHNESQGQHHGMANRHHGGRHH